MAFAIAGMVVNAAITAMGFKYACSTFPLKKCIVWIVLCFATVPTVFSYHTNVWRVLAVMSPTTAFP